ncbi:MAG: hypothetical protein GEV06_24205 [Luteitalea sp.]|nr:hypothetical protein [Luteitalea sp.]
MAQDQSDCHELRVLVGLEAIAYIDEAEELIADMQFVEEQRDQTTRPRKIARLVDEAVKDQRTKSRSPVAYVDLLWRGATP